MMSETEERVDTFHIRVAFEFDADKQQGISFVHSVKSVQPTAAELLKLMHCYRSEETEGLLRDVREIAQKWRTDPPQDRLMWLSFATAVATLLHRGAVQMSEHTYIAFSQELAEAMHLPQTMCRGTIQ
jgi:hypothetical protein